MGFKKGDPNNPGVKFGQGQIGNTRGRRPEIIEVAKAARTYTAEALETLARIMRDAKATASARVSAAIALLERGHGKAPQTIELHGHGDIRNLTDEQLLVIIGAAAEPSGDRAAEQAPDPTKLN